jgi:hypothetical protein
VVPLEDVVEEAAFWVRYASPSELRAYLTACFNTLPGEDRAGFLSVVTRRAAA